MGVGSGGKDTCNAPLNTVFPVSLNLSLLSLTSLGLLLNSSPLTTLGLGNSGRFVTNGSSLNVSENGSALSNGSVSSKGSDENREPLKTLPVGLTIDTEPPDCRGTEVMVVALYVWSPLTVSTVELKLGKMSESKLVEVVVGTRSLSTFLGGFLSS